MGDLLGDLGAHSPLVNKVMCSRSTHCVGCVVLSFVVGLTILGMLVGGAGLVLLALSSLGLAGPSLCGCYWPIGLQVSSWR